MVRRRKPKGAPKSAAAKSAAPRSAAPRSFGAKAAKAAPKARVRRIDDAFREWRFEPKAGTRDLLGVIALSIGALALGGGVYAQFVSAKDTVGHTYAPYLLAAGLAFMAGYFFLLGQRTGPIVVGELGIGFEQDGKVERTAWYELLGLTLEHDALRFKTAGKPLSLVLAEHPSAARFVVAQARERVPDRVQIADRDAARIGAPKPGEGVERKADPPQVTELNCRASGRPLSFESDVRLCDCCAALYHRAKVPPACLECGRSLKT
jgi:hypothetical protein